MTRNSSAWGCGSNRCTPRLETGYDPVILSEAYAADRREHVEAREGAGLRIEIEQCRCIDIDKPQYIPFGISERALSHVEGHIDTRGHHGFYDIHGSIFLVE
ncbi:hypothetical protein cym2001_41900 [Pseudomonas sp. CYM-20-01]|nr:hypothetical protein cym2001_41900 [Pseudomonas sp. CYM-20-01]